MNTRTAILAIVLAALVGTPAARASEADDAALRKDVKTLLEMVQDLQRRVSALEARTGQPAPGATVAPPAVPAAPGTAHAAPQPGRVAPIAAARPGMQPDYVSPEAMLKANWNQIDKGMDEAAIKALIGTPSTTFLLDGRLVWYYYYPGTGRGSVFFTDAGRVSSYQSPFPGFGW
ncbi:MAG TPA: hypothetical protein VF925_03965 [Casimicrobiaceae bacterium]